MEKIQVMEDRYCTRFFHMIMTDEDIPKSMRLQSTVLFGVIFEETRKKSQPEYSDLLRKELAEKLDLNYHRICDLIKVLEQTNWIRIDNSNNQFRIYPLNKIK